MNQRIRPILELPYANMHKRVSNGGGVGVGVVTTSLFPSWIYISL